MSMEIDVSLMSPAAALFRHCCELRIAKYLYRAEYRLVCFFWCVKPADRQLAHVLQGIYGGSIVDKPRIYKPLTTWRLSEKQVEPFLQTVKPLLYHEYKTRVVTALKFLKLRQETWKHRTVVTGTRIFHTYKHGDKEVQNMVRNQEFFSKAAELYAEMRGIK